MFLLFSKRYNLVKSRILNEKTDIHCHVLPGVDDGSPDVEHSLGLMDFLSKLGFKSVWLTPHVMEGLKNSTEKLRNRFDEFSSLYKGNCVLHLGAEYMLDAGFKSVLNNEPLLLGKEHLLVETSYMSPPADFDYLLQMAWERQYRPIIAHPERYMYMGESDYFRLKEQGYEFQLNIMSLSGYYGKRPKFFAEKLMEWGLYDFVGTDLHHLHIYEDMMEDMALTKKQMETLERLLTQNEDI